MSVRDGRFPHESEEYRAARDELLEAERDLRSRIENVATQRRRLPTGGAVSQDYPFEALSPEGETIRVKLSKLFAPEKNSLIVYNFMYGPEMAEPCPMCTSLIDGLNATARHANDRINLVVVAKSPIERIMEFARSRRWDQLRFLSSIRNSYNRDYWGEDEAGNQMPMINVFVRRDDSIHHFWGSELLYAQVNGQARHVDLIWPLWNLFDMTPEGRGTDWYPKLSYGR